MPAPVRKYLTEFIGTFFLVIAIFFTADPLAIGLALTGLIYAGGHISMAHYNPVVTLAMWQRGACKSSDVLPYVVAQLTGAALAALVAHYTLPASQWQAAPFAGTVPALIVEFLGTFLLVFVILNVAIAKGTANNSFYGVAIGFTVMGLATAFGGLSGGAFNPAVAFGACLHGVFSWDHLWIYLLASVLGGTLAAVAFKYVAEH